MNNTGPDNSAGRGSALVSVNPGSILCLVTPKNVHKEVDTMSEKPMITVI